MPHSISVTAFCFVILSLSMQSQANDVEVDYLNLGENNLIAEGYDLVSYYTSNKPTNGGKHFAVHFKGAVYYFSSEKNKRVFLKNPLDYLPEYGGWCAYAIGKYGEKVSIDPLLYIVKNGDLYLFYNSYFNNTKDKWIKKQTKLHHKADENWFSITNKQNP